MSRERWTHPKIQKAVAQGEGQCAEFKQSLAEDKDAIECLCAFANAKGGAVFFGVRNDSTAVGVTVGQNTIANLAAKISSNLDPQLFPSIETPRYGGKTLVVVDVDALRHLRPVRAYGKAYVRVGDRVQAMSPEIEKDWAFYGWHGSDLDHASSKRSVPGRLRESWQGRDQRRARIYQEQRGLFLVHSWRPSKSKGQVADIVISLRQHPGPDTPLTDGKIKSVEYHLPGLFFPKGQAGRALVKRNAARQFRLEVSAYGPFLCLARVNFKDGNPPIQLERYVDF